MAELKPRQQQIVDVAIRLIAEGGIQQLTMNNIAQRIGISEPALYRHFTSKKDILLTILTQFERHSEFQAKKARFFESSGLILLETIFLEYLAHFAKTPDLAAVVFAEESFKGEQDVLAKMLAIMTLINDTIVEVAERAQTRGEIRADIPAPHLALTFLGTLRLLVKQWALSGHAFDVQQEGRRVWDSWKVLLAPTEPLN